MFIKGLLIHSKNKPTVNGIISLTCINEMVESWKPFLNSWRDHRENHAETEADVAHDSSPHEPPSLILSVKLP